MLAEWRGVVLRLEVQGAKYSFAGPCLQASPDAAAFYIRLSGPFSIFFISIDASAWSSSSIWFMCSHVQFPMKATKMQKKLRRF
jgi:hypothetical protein